MTENRKLAEKIQEAIDNSTIGSLGAIEAALNSIRQELKENKNDASDFKLNQYPNNQKLRLVKPSEDEIKLAAFLDGLTELTRKYGIGIAGTPVLSCLESDDYGMKYTVNEESELSY